MTTKCEWMRLTKSVWLLLVSVALLPALASCGGTDVEPSATPQSMAPIGNATATASSGISSRANTDLQELPAHWQFLSGVFPKYANVFGVNIFATAGTPDAKVIHASNVMAQYLDNNGDGEPGNPDVVRAMTRANASLLMTKTEAKVESLLAQVPRSFLEMVEKGQVRVQGLYGSETKPEHGFDASLEEVLHLISSVGYAQTYPDVFGEEAASTIAAYMDTARGGHFEERQAADCEAAKNGPCALPPSGEYPAGAWYTYRDPTCDYACMVSEYFYWALTTILGAQSDAQRCGDISREWAACTAEQLKSKDPDVYDLLTNPQYALPRILPDGSYDPATP